MQLFPIKLLGNQVSGSQKCPRPLSSSLASGVSMRSSCRNNIQRETCKIPSTCRVLIPSPFVDYVELIPAKDPKHSLPPNPEYYKKVSTIHEHGGYGSAGYRAPWVHEESSKLLLRTHTTASSAHMLYKLAARCRGEAPEDDAKQFTHGAAPTSGPSSKDGKDDGFRPAKLFSIDRVFRNETMDATHLAEFHQVEGVVADRNLKLADLIGQCLIGSLKGA